MSKAIYPGSFDPITLGHLDIIRRITPLFEELTVVVANSQRKKYLFTLPERVALIRENLSESAVKIDICEGLMTDYATQHGAQVMVRGLRAVSDFEYEFAMANINKNLKEDLETMIVFTSPEYSFVASSMVKEVAHHGGDLSGLVPTNVARALAEKVKGDR
ncbi:MAG: pantetheine-phosphate adenylyltransferase [Bdellovibrionales bacterium]